LPDGHPDAIRDGETPFYEGLPDMDDREELDMRFFE
jgi:hypothetical protein